MKTKRLSALFSATLLSVSSLLGVGFASVVGATAANCTWTGATDTNFSTATNWSNCNGTAPQAGDNLVFDNTSFSSAPTLNDDISGLSVGSVTLQGSNSNSYGVTISGSALTITTSITDSNTVAGTALDFQNGITLGGNVTVTGGTGYIDFDGIVSGTGNITLGSGVLFLNGANTFTGTVTANAGTLRTGSSTALGNAANAISINAGADISIGACSGTGFTVANSITLTGASSQPSGSFPVSKLSTGAVCKGAGAPTTDETYSQADTVDQAYTLSGHITLGSDVVFGALAKTTTITGTLSGAYKFTLPNTWGGTLVVNSSNNTSAMKNGTYTVDPITQTLSDSQPTHTVLISGPVVTITIDGTRGDTTVTDGATLKGTGTVGALTVNSGTVAPGHSPGCMQTGNLSLTGTYQAEIGGTTACTGYDQLKVTGTVTLGGTLDVSLYNNFKPVKGQTYEIISNDGTDAVSGTFSGLAEGATFKVGTNVFQITYKGGDGNDVVLSVQSAPDTGFGLAAAHPAITLLTTLAAAGVIAGLAQRTRKATARR